ncbi:MAG: site-specific integrase [SAR202 cluster bacterium]|nr:site-specific integrase [SAR202 cluster bacterium]
MNVRLGATKRARRSELLALRWRDLDLLLCQMSVNKGLHHLWRDAAQRLELDGRFVTRPPKTAQGRRLIALPPSAAMVLREHHEQQEAERELLGATLGADDLVFAQPDGSPLLSNSVTHAWIKLVRRLGLAGVRLHDARHSHASLLLKAGVHPKVVQERLGHSKIGTTLDLYSHVAPGLQEAAAARFDGFLTKAPAALNGKAAEALPALV